MGPKDPSNWKKIPYFFFMPNFRKLQADSKYVSLKIGSKGPKKLGPFLSLFLMRKTLSSGQKWFLRTYFPLIRGMFLLKSGLRFSFWALALTKWWVFFFIWRVFRTHVTNIFITTNSANFTPTTFLPHQLQTSSLWDMWQMCSPLRWAPWLLLWGGRDRQSYLLWRLLLWSVCEIYKPGGYVLKLWSFSVSLFSRLNDLHFVISCCALLINW